MGFEEFKTVMFTLVIVLFTISIVAAVVMGVSIWRRNPYE